MPTRLVKPRPPSKPKDSNKADRPSSSQRDSNSGVTVSVLTQDPAQATSIPKLSSSKLSGLLHGRRPSRSTLSPVPPGSADSTSRSMANGVNGKPLPSTPASPPIPSRMASTIRPVRSFDDRDRSSEDSSSSTAPSPNASRNSAFSSSLNSNMSGMSGMSQQQQYQQQRSIAESTPSVRLKQSHSLAVMDGPSQTPSLEVPGLLSPRRSVETTRSSVEIPQRESSLTAVTSSANLAESTQQHHGNGSSSDMQVGGASPEMQSNGWDSTIGKAGLGKTGRVINRLVSDNEALKRDIKIERLRAEESKQTARLLEDKMERLSSDFESRLLEANVTKALLARKERQVESLQSTVEQERRRAVDAGERERVWKDEMEKVRAEAKQQVEEAVTHAGLMEGRYNAISSHWRDQGDEAKRAVAKMKAEIGELVEERRKDDDRIGTLRDLCDQQDGNIRDLRRQKDDIAASFERYKAEQEEALRAIKTKAAEREAEQERMLREAKEVLDKLRWALNVKQTVPGAQ